MKRYELPAEGFADKGEKKAFWSKVAAAQKQSGKTQKEFCNLNGLSLSTFKNWLKKEAKEKRPQFVQLELPVEENRQSDSGGIEIRLPFGRQINLSSEDLPELLKMLFNLLRKRRC